MQGHFDSIRDALIHAHRQHAAGKLGATEMTTFVNFVSMRLAQIEAQALPATVLPVMTMAEVVEQARRAPTLHIIAGGKA